MTTFSEELAEDVIIFLRSVISSPHSPTPDMNRPLKYDAHPLYVITTTKDKENNIKDIIKCIKKNGVCNIGLINYITAFHDFSIGYKFCNIHSRRHTIGSFNYWFDVLCEKKHKIRVSTVIPRGSLLLEDYYDGNNTIVIVSASGCIKTLSIIHSCENMGVVEEALNKSSICNVKFKYYVDIENWMELKKI